MIFQQRRKYDPDFKRNAVLFSEEEGETVTEVVENLGISKLLTTSVAVLPFNDFTKVLKGLYWLYHLNP